MPALASKQQRIVVCGTLAVAILLCASACSKKPDWHSVERIVVENRGTVAISKVELSNDVIGWSTDMVATIEPGGNATLTSSDPRGMPDTFMIAYSAYGGNLRHFGSHDDSLPRSQVVITITHPGVALRVDPLADE